VDLLHGGVYGAVPNRPFSARFLHLPELSGVPEGESPEKELHLVHTVLNGGLGYATRFIWWFAFDRTG
jgi:hypothetical protein